MGPEAWCSMLLTSIVTCTESTGWSRTDRDGYMPDSWSSDGLYTTTTTGRKGIDTAVCHNRSLDDRQELFSPINGACGS